MSGGAWKGNGESLLVFEGGCNLVSGQKKTRGSWCDCPGARFDVQMWGREKMGEIWRNKQPEHSGKDHTLKWLQRLGRSFKQGVSMESWGLWHTVWQGQPLLRASWWLPCRKWDPAGTHLFSFSREISNSDFKKKKYKISHILNYGN